MWFCVLSPNISWGNMKPQTANITLPIIFVSNYNMKGEGGGGGPEMFAQGWNSCFHVTLNAIAAWRPLFLYSCTYHVQFLSNGYSSLRICANTVWKMKFNGYRNECWLNRSEKQEEGDARDPERRRGLFRCSGVVGFREEEWFWGETWLFFPLCFSLVHRGVVCYKKAGRSLDTHH